MEDTRGWLMLMAWVAGLWFLLADGAARAVELSRGVRARSMDPRSAVASFVRRTFIGLVVAIALVGVIELFPEKGGDMAGFFTLVTGTLDCIVVGLATAVRTFNIYASAE